MPSYNEIIANNSLIYLQVASEVSSDSSIQEGLFDAIQSVKVEKRMPKTNVYNTPNFQKVLKEYTNSRYVDLN